MRRLAWIVAGIVVLAWRAGWGTFPDARWLANDIVPSLPSLPPVDPLAQYSLYSPIGSFLVALLHIHGETGYVLAHVVAFVAFAVAVGAIVVRRRGWSTGGLLGAAFVGSSTSVVLLAWLGSYDVFTVGLTSLLVVVRDRRVAVGLGVLLALSGFEQAVFVLAALAIMGAVGVGVERMRLAWAAVGLVAGRIGLEVWLRSNDVTHGRSWFLRQIGIGHVTRTFLHGVGWYLVTAFGATILAVVVAVVRLPSARARIVTVAVLVAALVPTALSLDPTRVFAILTWPIVMTLLLDHADRSEPRDAARLGAGTLVFAAIVPGVFVWEGRAQLSAHSAIRWLARR